MNGNGGTTAVPEKVTAVQVPRSRGGWALYPAVKELFDFALALCGSLLLLIPLAVLALLVMIIDPGNPIYVQKRVGRNGEVLPVVKLRSMKIGADNLKNTLTPEQLAEYRQEYKLEDDPRLIGYKDSGSWKTCFGAFLRRTSLDELPQIVWNICIKRNMSLVGPRPILQEELERHYTAEEQKRLLSVKPGLTGYWKAYAGNDATYGTGARQRMELYYVDHCSLGLDLRILAATVVGALTGRGT